jgi:two-component system, response regulator
VRTLRVLLVEDDPDHVFLVRRALGDLAGVEATVEVAGDGEQASQRLARARFEPGGPPQLVLLDLKMPRMGGLELLGRIRADEATRRLPVVVLTSSERQEDREEALRQGATWFVCKPTDGRRFRSELQQLADRWARAGA